MNRTTSLYLDIIRPLAAFMVLLSHATFANLSDGQIGFMAPLGVQAVDAFFVLSGFVIAYVCTTKEKDAASYFISRATRIYSVAIPALLLVIVLDGIGMKKDAATYDGPFQNITAGLLIRSVLFIGEMWHAHRFPGSDGPYWSLGFEVWYYIAFGMFMFAPGKWRWIMTVLVMCVIGPKVVVMFPVWLMGVAAYYICRKKGIAEPVGWVLFLFSFILLAVYEITPHSPLQPFINLSFSLQRLETTAQDYFLGLVFSMNIIGFSAVSHRFASVFERGARAIRWIAGGTFSLYLMHLPVMYLVSAFSPWPKSSHRTLALMIIVTPVICMLLAEVSERRKNIWRGMIVALMPPRLSRTSTHQPEAVSILHHVSGGSYRIR